LQSLNQGKQATQPLLFYHRNHAEPKKQKGSSGYLLDAMVHKRHSGQCISSLSQPSTTYIAFPHTDRSTPLRTLCLTPVKLDKGSAPNAEQTVADA